jgi:hypothetical protein
VADLRRGGGAKVLYAIASCLAGPVLAAISLGLVGHTLLGNRFGRNARFLSLGNAIPAGLMGGVAHYYLNQATFFLTAALSVPTAVALAQIRCADQIRHVEPIKTPVPVDGREVILLKLSALAVDVVNDGVDRGSCRSGTRRLAAGDAALADANCPGVQIAFRATGCLHYNF